ncbi:seryl-tRNA synthetase [Aurantiacibacter atlanticus]|uniref:Serine--tRNA ligase n=1 Tax=Aurantiacibacter atlanticus TaxID=1648404 RepID=A0A0H4VA57_9SPHN|nr:serine--tRNA ligase [Aurantiacibacter atlanticus]AKQ41517.1 seryl-tRNA synthetase [Aurantiacibacter atlanticus]MDF1833321.1 serine--tRNA ligase [Alteraurantiacibacter sp. bin_em_oilr2.035]
MHDLRYIRDNPEDFDAALAKRAVAPAAAHLLALDEERRALTTRLQEAQSRRNDASKAIGQAMGQGDTEKAEALKAEVAEIKAIMPALEDRERALGAELTAALASLPNIPADDVPVGEDEADNVELSRWGTPREFSFTPLEHADLGPPLGMEFETAAKMSGSRFTFLRAGMARLHRALAQFMLDQQTDMRGFTECNPPVLVRDEALFGTGQLPKFAEDQFHADDHWLIPTAEVSLTNSVREEIIGDLTDPMRLTALTQCFRSEAGSAGKDTRGFIRQHQFEKVELVSICRPQSWQEEHDHMVASAEAILQALDLPYRTMLLCSGDMGFTAKKTYDLEVWLPGQNAYREISSISWCGDFQARRMKARYRPDEGDKKTEFVHTLNGSGLAVGRTLVAVLENYQQEDGSVIVPDVVQPYMGGVKKLVSA